MNNDSENIEQQNINAGNPDALTTDVNRTKHAKKLSRKEKRELKRIKKLKSKMQKKQNKKGKGIHVGIGSLVLIFFCSFLIVVATFLQLDVTHFIIPMKFFKGEPCAITDFVFSIKYIPQIPIVLFVVGLLGRKLGLTSIVLYVLAGLLFVPIFALGGGWRYIFEYGFGYILGYIPATFILGTILKKNYTYKNTLKGVILAVLTIHLIGICYMFALALAKHTGMEFVKQWIVAQSGIKILYDIVFSYLAILATKYLRIILWFYL